jgi:hypothetical protein
MSKLANKIEIARLIDAPIILTLQPDGSALVLRGAKLLRELSDSALDGVLKHYIPVANPDEEREVVKMWTGH